MINNEFITISIKLNNEMYSFWYCIFNYDDNLTLYLYASYMYFIVIFITNFDLVVCFHFYHNFLEAVKELHKVPFSILIYIIIVKITIPFTSKQQIPNIQSISGISQLWWDRSQYSCKL